MSQFKEDRFLEGQEQLRQQSEAAFKSWLTKHPEVDYEAARKMFRDYADFSDGLTEADFDFAYSNLESRINKQRVPTVEETKAELIAQILDLLKQGGTGYDAFNLKTVATKMLFWTVEQLTARRDVILVKQRQAKETLTQNYSELRTGRQYDGSGYPQLPKQIVRPGTVRAVPLDAEYIKRLDVFDLKRLNRLYGTEQVNARLQSKD